MSRNERAPSRFAAWLTFESSSDQWASLAALGLGIVALVVVALL